MQMGRRWREGCHPLITAALQPLTVSEVLLPDSRDQIMKELLPELKMLDGAADQSFQKFIKFLFKTFPPKHRENAKKSQVEVPNNADEKRRAYFILCSFYHPNKVDVKKHGMKYKDNVPFWYRNK